ncbi:diaminohydroxyphosphoribosylaminopyrimidine deaminase/5-amino-6-(5-phosphoribosylamino)uracil reductase [Thermosulfidibacter takaii ABI70S6]|uniref:Riboflavin biosynthesis protein RibD n=1 Tax=Thermosulfidibacter takaii (strain DSM 17441 / JCM 13301 / NBRC 103674 / ABI70S6) TaxID=1298851 RepID=A0A0S3QST7_THET7|nr:bifunctional diaminohydroxyphosphoribosylaminopyrimidine deaminase/5-amino-6-(5-phosphoribosylamino)uracil reductase RibD [Thermosulfidibacter takaii]BAT71385.1 diaminohydroxyphosphoribosylaminopyrimidine deaminase/5-amino-6-(5-phosphoribosylamino)uracil reductase [Thermosulfidibacter takaii ABI70S6]
MRFDEYFMWRALALARRGQGYVSPNPMVGAVVVSPDGEILAEGYHRKFGDLHAERIALKKLNFKAHGAILYVNLEPCCHYGKTPPCTEAIIESGIKRVVVGVLDPNPKVAGKGVDILKKHGIEVKVGVLEKQCYWLNRGFFKWVRKGIPYVILKWAQTLDGNIATIGGDSKWISGKVALRYAHKLRAESDAVLVGKGTVLADDPQLTVRLVKGKNPMRVVLDSNLSVPVDRKIFDTSAKTVVFTVRPNHQKEKVLSEKGIEIVATTSDDGNVNLIKVLEELGKKGVTKLLVEGGSKVHASFIKSKLFDEIQVVVAPKIVGEGKPPVADLNILKIDDALKLSFSCVRRLREDLLVVAEPLES